MLEEYKKIRNAYDRFADDYAENCSGVLLSQIKSFMKELPEPAYVLDIGCGVGQDTLYLARQGVETIGIDFSEKMLEIANKESRTVKKAGFIKLEVSKISSYLKEVKFDGFWCSSLITHLTLKDIKKLLKDIKKISDNNSIFGITVKERKDKNAPITSDRKIIDHEKDRETLIHKGGKIQDHEIIVFERSPRVLRVSRRAFLFVKK